ncbi:hypothetical protein ACL90Y_09145 [Micrococcus luteus]
MPGRTARSPRTSRGERFFLGLLTVSRPLVSQERWHLPGQEDWMLRTYLRGLRPQG